MGTLVFIPAWNEEASIAAVVADVREHLPAADILVVDDGSTDATTARARECGVLVATLPFNQGLGAAVRRGLAEALDRGAAAVAPELYSRSRGFEQPYRAAGFEEIGIQGHAFATNEFLPMPMAGRWSR